jgi:hypothetical protein
VWELKSIGIELSEEDVLRCCVNQREICIADVEHWCCLEFIHCEHQPGGSRGFSRTSETTFPHCHPIRNRTYQVQVAEQCLHIFKDAVDMGEWAKCCDEMIEKSNQTLEKIIATMLSVKSQVAYTSTANQWRRLETIVSNILQGRPLESIQLICLQPDVVQD